METDDSLLQQEEVVITTLFDKLIGKGGFDSEKSYLIKQDGIIENILVLLKLCGELASKNPNSELGTKYSLLILNNLFCMFYKSTRNLFTCKNLDCLGVLLEWLPNIQNERIFALSLTETLGSFSINVRQIKKYLSLLVEPGISEDKKILLINALQSITNRHIPKCFFDFDGVESGIKLPIIDKFPSSNYSVSLWMCVESFEDPSNSPLYAPRLFCFLNERGVGLEAFFVKKKLIIRSNLKSNQSSKLTVPLNFETQRWYHVVLVHQYSKMEWLGLANSGLKVYINGKLVLDSALKYPDTSEALPVCYIGCSHAVNNAFVNIPKENVFYGQMSTFILFSEALSSSAIGELFELGYNYIPNFHEKDLLTRSGAPNILILQSPRTTMSKACMNLGQYQQSLERGLVNVVNMLPLPNKKQQDPNGKLIGQTSVVTVSDIKDTLYGASGMEYIQQTQELHASTINAVINLMSDLIAGHSANQNEFLDRDCCALMGFVFQKISSNMDTLTIGALGKFIHAISSNESLVLETYKHLILNFDIWITTPFNIQQELANFILKSIQKQNTLFRQSFGVQLFLDILRNYYFFTEENSSAQFKSYAIGNRNLTESQIKTIRSIFLQSIEGLIYDSIELEEVQQIIYFLQDCTESQQITDGLRLIFNLLSAKPPIKNLLNHLETLGGLKVFFCGVSRIESVCVMSYKLIGKYLQLNPLKQKLKFLSEYAAAFASSSESADEFGSLTFNTYCCLIEIILEDISLDIPNDHSKLITNTNIKLANPQIFPSLFKLLKSAQHELRQKVLQEFLICFRKHTDFANAFMDLVGWQGWFLSLLVTTGRSLENMHLSHDDSTDEILNNPPRTPVVPKSISKEHELDFNMIEYIFSFLLHQKALTKDGWKMLEETESYIHLFIRNGFIDGNEFAKELYISLLNDLEADVIKSEQNKSLPIWKNLSNFLVMVEEFSSVPFVKRESKEYRSDFGLILRVLDIFDFSLRPSNDHLSGIELPSGKGKEIFMIILKLTLYTFQEGYFHFYKDIDSKDDSEETPKSDDSPRLEELHTNVELEKLFYKNVQRVRPILQKVLIVNNAMGGPPGEKEMQENGKTLVWILHYLFKSLKRSHKMADTSYVIVAQLVKEIVRNYLEYIRTYLELDIDREFIQLCQDSAPIKEFMKYYLNTLSWKFEITNKIEFAKTQFEINETKQYLPLITQRREKNVEIVKGRVKRDSQSDVSNKKRVITECLSLNQKQRTAESMRRSTAAIVHVETQKNMSQLWKKTFRRLTGDRTCLASLDKTPPNYWKLDPTENRLRMRLKMKKNYHGTDHKEASLAYKRAQTIAILEQAENSSIEANEENLIKAMSNIHIKVKKEAEDSLEEFDFEDNELEESWCVVDYSEDKDKTRVADKILLSTYCDMITPLAKIEGRLLITPSKPSQTKKKDKKWPHDKIADIQRRRFLLRNNALEVFMSDTHKSYMFNFPTGVNKKVLQTMSKLCKNVQPHILTPAQLLKNSGYTQKWLKREISNFEYLMILNTFAGRTYNDLTQYPVFPWVLMDYESNNLDLSDPKIYRDLTKPVGALNPARLRRFQERAEAFEDPAIPKFLYGSHYSSIGSVLYYLIRMEPFTTQFLENLQGGKFDVADRMFHSVGVSHKNCMTSPSDVKELIPEFYYTPEFLRNVNGFDLGVKQDGVRLNDVLLPPWAQTPEDFVRINREALESEYVSNNLHEWIDLIFGFKQRGKPAEKAHNLFYYLTYEGAVDIDSIEDAVERAAVESQIANFGQTPAQLLFHAHPKRDPLLSKGSPFSHPGLLKVYTLYNFSFTPISLFVLPSEIIAFSENCEMNSHYLDATKPTISQPGILMSNDKGQNLPCVFTESSHATNSPMIQEFIAQPITVFDNYPNTFVACSKWDNSFWLIENSKVVQINTQHTDTITCFAVGEDSSLLVSGSRDATICVWEVNEQPNKAKSCRLSKKPLHILRGHDDEVTCVAISVDLDLCVSGSKDGSIVFHTLEYGRYIRSVNHPKNYEINKLALSHKGDVVTYSGGDNLLHLFTINGRLICGKSADDFINQMLITKERNHLFTSGRRIIMRQVHNLEILHIYELGMSSSFGLSKEEQMLFAALENGKLVVIGEAETK